MCYNHKVTFYLHFEPEFLKLPILKPNKHHFVKSSLFIYAVFYIRQRYSDQQENNRINDANRIQF